MTKLLEKHLGRPSGVADDGGEDEYLINPSEFVSFFESFWQEDWLGNWKSGLYHTWAAFAAGMVENITLTARHWVDRNGDVLEVIRCERPGECGSGKR